MAAQVGLAAGDSWSLSGSSLSAGAGAPPPQVTDETLLAPHPVTFAGEQAFPKSRSTPSDQAWTGPGLIYTPRDPRTGSLHPHQSCHARSCALNSRDRPAE